MIYARVQRGIRSRAYVGAVIVIALTGCADVLAPAPHSVADAVERPDAGARVDAGRTSDAGRAVDSAASDVTDDPPDAAQPDAAQPDAAQPDAAQPDAAQPDAAQPDAAQPDAAQPDAAQPDAAQPDAAQPDAARPDAAQPDVAPPDAGDPSDAGSAADTGTPPNGGADSGTTPTRSEILQPVKSWAFQLQRLSGSGIDAIQNASFGAVVISYSTETGPAGELSAAQVDRMKSSGNPDHSKLMLAYLSIGEAEIGRFYFDNGWVTPNPIQNPSGPFTLTNTAPAFLAAPNPQFPDNLKVRFWDPVWQQIIIANPGGHPIIGDQKSYLDRIIDQGFDGVYLDIIDAFQYFGPSENSGNNERRMAAQDMIAFVGAIAHHARVDRRRPSFLVIPQNGSDILQPYSFPDDTIPQGMDSATFIAQQGQAYLDAIDAIGAEDTYYYGALRENNSLSIQQNVLSYLQSFRDAGKTVFSVEYLSPNRPNPNGLDFPDVIDEYYAEARGDGFVPFATVRSLNALTINPSQPPAR